MSSSSKSRSARTSSFGVAIALFLALGIVRPHDAAAAGADTAGDPAVEMQSELHDMLPDAIKDRGSLRIHIQSNAGMPYGVVDGDTFGGLSADAARAIAQALGVKAEIIGADFSAMIPGIQSGRYDMSTSVTTDTPERRKVLDFVDVGFGEGSSIVTRKGTEAPAMKDACGMTLAAGRGSTQEKSALEQAKICADNGRPELVVKSFASPAECVLATISGRVDGLVAGTGQSYYLSSSNPQLSIGTSGHEKTTVLGFTTKKGSDLTAALRQTMLYLHKEGIWEKMLAKYGLEALKPTTELIEYEGDDVASFLPEPAAQ